MGFLSKAWKGIKKAVKKIGDKTGIDDAITAIPGSKKDAAMAAKIAALAAGAYFAAPAIGGLMAGGGGAAAGAAGTAAAGAGTAAAGTAAGLGTLGGMETVLATAPAWGGISAGTAAGIGAGAAGLSSALSGGSAPTMGADGIETVNATANAANPAWSGWDMAGIGSGALSAADALAGLNNPVPELNVASDNSWLKNLSNIGNNLGGAVGSYLGGKEQAQGYADAQKILEQMGQKADYASKLSDPFQSYRGAYAQQLDDTMQGRRSITTDPGYQFQYNEGQRAVERASSARGMSTSGNMMTALQQRGQDVASQQYGTIIDRLTNLAGASSQNAQAGGQIYGNMMGTALQGQASAALGQGMTNAASTGGVSSGVGSALGSLAGSFLGSQTGQNLISNVGSKIASFF